MCQIKSPTEFKSLIDLTLYFNTEEKCLQYLEQWAWGGKVSCPHCKHESVYRYKSGNRFFCYGCKYKFTLKMGTIFESSKLPLAKWYMAIYLIANNKKGISSYQLSGAIGVTQKTAWFMLTKLRSTLKETGDEQLQGVVMCDESFVGGKNKNRHLDKKAKKVEGRLYNDKITVLGMMEMGGKVRTRAISQPTSVCILPQIYRHVKPKTILVTDEWAVYQNMSEKYEYETQMVRHARKEFMNDCGFTTNPLEGYWSFIKRTYNGTYHKMSRKHIQRYLDEIAFRYNYREMGSQERLNLIMGKSVFTMTQKDIRNEKEIPEHLIIPNKKKRSYQRSGKYIGKFTGKNIYGRQNQAPAND